MATAAVLRSHDVIDNRMHLEAFSVSPASKPRRRRHTKPAGAAASPPPKMAAVSSPPVVKTARVASPPPKAAAAATPGRRSPPARPAARKQSSPAKELPKQRLVMEEIRILKRGEEPPVPAPAPVLSSSPAPVVAQAAPVDQRVPRVPAVAQAAPIYHKVPRATRSKQQHPQPAIVSTKIKSVANAAAGYAGPAFSAASPEPSSLPFPAFIRRAEAEATRGLRCLLRIGGLP